MRAAIIGVFLVAFLLFVWYTQTKRTEGFYVAQGRVPRSTQSSSIPSDTPGASTNNPTVSLPQTRDIKALIDVVNNFMKLSETTPKTNLQDVQKVKITSLENTAKTLSPQFDTWLANPASANMRLSDMTLTRTKFTDGIRILRNTPASTNKVSPPPSKPVEQKLAVTTVATEPRVITLVSLRALRDRIQAEIRNLDQLRSSSPTIRQRRTQLDRLATDLNNYISSVERKTKKIEDIPIFQEDADAFLKVVNNLSKPLPNVIRPVAVPSSSKPAPSPSKPVTEMDKLQPLLEMAKFLKWNLNIGIAYDPEIKQRERFMERIEAMETRLTNMMISETPVPPDMFKMYMKELNVLQAMLEAKNDKPRSHEKRRDITTDHSSIAEYPTKESLDYAQGKGFGTTRSQLPNGEETADVYVRPGVVMTEDDIQNRGSKAAFDPSMVGGVDYKKRALDLCRQVKSADLGVPSSFGCIDDPSVVSQTYSWKGNYEMVCRRLGDTWGAWYPEMFGCPKYNPTSKYAGRP